MLFQQSIHAEKILDKVLTYDVILVVKNNIDKPIIEEVIKGEVTQKVMNEMIRLSKFNKKRRMLMLFGVNGLDSAAFYTINRFGRVCEYDDKINKEDCISVDKIKVEIKNGNK